jgi:GntR family transcriptional regulator, transcriptional repressor for pyruvate dehydrogenase complex
VGRLREYVTSAGLHTGDRLPAERDLADRLGVSRTSVRQAIVALEVQGLIEVRHGDGTYLLRDRLEAEPLQAMIERKRLLPDVLDARDAAETKLAALAAARRREPDLRAMDDAIAAMRAAVAGGGLGIAGDQRFHGAVIAAARSPLLAEFMAALAAPIAETRRSSLGEPGRPPRSLHAHQRILEAIQRGDGPGARQAMRRHVKMVADIGLLRWSAAGPPAGAEPYSGAEPAAGAERPGGPERHGGAG